MINKYSILPGVIGAMLSFSYSTAVFADVQSTGVNDTSTDSHYQVSAEVTNNYAELLKDAGVNNALAFLKSDQENAIAQQIEITEIPAPTFKEQRRGQYFKSQLEALGLDDVQMDDIGNVYGIRHGTGNGPVLYVTAHLDTVFNFDKINVKNEDGILHAPGIGDDSRGLAAVLSMVRAFNESGINTTGDIIFGGDVHEVGFGNSEGAGAVVKAHLEYSGFIAIYEDSPADITYLGTDSYNNKITLHC